MRAPDFLFATTYPIVFDEGRLDSAPLGGSETALVEVSRRLAARGLAVEVFAPAPREGERAGIRWGKVADLEREMTSGQVRPRVLVICRDAALAPLARHAGSAWLWLQDMPMEGLRKVFRACLERVDRVLCISDFQRDRFAAVFDIPAATVAERFCRTRNGLDLERYRKPGGILSRVDSDEGRIRGRCVYASAPFRGLSYLLDAWPGILERAPRATLEVLGGMVTYDQPDDPFAHLYRRAAGLPGVTVTGAVPQAELLRAMRRAELLLYPCSFKEAGCIVVQMAIAAGIPPLTSAIACLPEYVAGRGIVVPANPRGGGNRSKAFVEAFTLKASELLNSPESIGKLRADCAAHQVDWGPELDRWIRWAEIDA